MKISPDILVKLCTCPDTACTKPHTIKELEEATGEILVDSNQEKVDCIECGKPDEVSTYVYEGALEAYCGICGINFDVEKKTLITMEDTPEPSKKHKMHFDGQLYQCDTCTFETHFMQEVVQHENGAIISPVDANKSLTLVKKDKPEEELHYTKFVSQGVWRCIYCKEEFNDFNKSLAHENAAGRRAQGFTGGTSYSTTSYAHCTHKPQLVMTGKEEGWSIYAGRKWDCEPVLNDFDIVLNLTGNKVSRCHDIPVKALKKWESKEKFKEICLDWPDHGIVSLPRQFWKELFTFIKTGKKKMVVFCIGGHGRTGTAIASLLVTGFNYQPQDACKWIWDNYCKEAIETSGQINYVYNLAGKTYIPPKEDKDSQKNLPLYQGAWD